MNHLGAISFFAAAFAVVTTSYAAELSTQNKKELSVFGMRAMGARVGVGDVKNVLTRPEIEKLVQAGLNLNGHLCAQITDIRPLRISGTYEVTCVAYQGGSAKKTYVLEALKGVAFVP
ncbi:MAG: hypothetical protein Q8L56_06675 [Rhodocyclaceae bacterium]|nr:hypothetical protein [Rhodocyclaceae bacterium]